MTLQIGDLVRLKSGGPTMTVVAEGGRSDPGVVDCAWFGGGDSCATAVFPLRALERVTLAPLKRVPASGNRLSD
jgi:uncharacterized protein YodC (DUF2158 family)